MAAATAISKVGEAPSVHGGRLEFWKFTLDPGSIAAAAQEVDTVAIPGAKAGDPCFASCEVPEASLICGGAAVTADDVVSIYISNNITVTTAFDGGSKVWNLQILKRTVVGA